MIRKVTLNFLNLRLRHAIFFFKQPRSPYDPRRSGRPKQEMKHTQHSIKFKNDLKKKTMHRLSTANNDSQSCRSKLCDFSIYLTVYDKKKMDMNNHESYRAIQYIELLHQYVGYVELWGKKNQCSYTHNVQSKRLVRTICCIIVTNK